MRKVRWTRRALRQLDNIAAYISERDPVAADRVVKRIGQRVNQLLDHPYMAPAGRQPDTREMFVGNYRYKVVYRIKDDIEILVVFHTAQENSDH